MQRYHRKGPLEYMLSESGINLLEFYMLCIDVLGQSYCFYDFYMDRRLIEMFPEEMDSKLKTGVWCLLLGKSSLDLALGKGSQISCFLLLMQIFTLKF
jgi:hypothetical protein